MWLKLDLLVWVPWGDCNLVELDETERTRDCGLWQAGRLCTLHWTLHPSCPPTATATASSTQCLFAGGLYLRLYLYLNISVWLRISSSVSVSAPVSAAVSVSVAVSITLTSIWQGPCSALLWLFARITSTANRVHCVCVCEGGKERVKAQLPRVRLIFIAFWLDFSIAAAAAEAASIKHQPI